VTAGGSDRDVIFEITRVRDVQRVAAIDVATGVEVVVQAPASAALSDVRALALRKLERALEDQTPPPPKRPGTLA
jgi:hypothetical protein